MAGNQSANNTGLLMPKLKFRYRAIFDNFGVASNTGGRMEITKQLMTFARPQVTFEPVTLPVYNSQVYVAGRPVWNPVSVTIRDDAGGLVTTQIGEQLQKQFDFYEQASATSGGSYKFQTTLQLLDGANGAIDPVVLEEWQLVGCFLTDVNYNDMDYGSNDPVTITMSIRYDNALQTVGGSVGSETGLTSFNVTQVSAAL